MSNVRSRTSTIHRPLNEVSWTSAKQCIYFYMATKIYAITSRKFSCNEDEMQWCRLLKKSRTGLKLHPSTLQHLIVPFPTSSTLPPSSTWMKRRAYSILTQLTGLTSPTAVHWYHGEEGYQMLPSPEWSLLWKHPQLGWQESVIGDFQGCLRVGNQRQVNGGQQKSSAGWLDCSTRRHALQKISVSDWHLCVQEQRAHDWHMTCSTRRHALQKKSVWDILCAHC